MIRTLALSVVLPPTRENSPSCRTRRIFPCKESGMSPISSRKSVPPWLCSKRPTRCAIAPVKEPFSCPNSSLSSNCSGIAAQLIATKSFPLRWL